MLVEIRAVLGLEIERALDAQQPRVEQPLRRAAEVLEDAQQRVDRRVLDLVARATHEVQRLGRDVAVRARDRRRLDRRLREVLHERRRRARASRRPRGRRDPWPAGRARSTTRARACRRRRASPSSGRASRVSIVRRGRLDLRQRREQLLDPARVRARSACARRARAGRSACPGRARSRRGRARPSARGVVAPRSRRRSITRSHSAAGRVAASRSSAIDLGLEPRLAAAQLRDLDLIERLVELAVEDQHARGGEPRLAVAEQAGAVEPGAVVVRDLGLVLAPDREQRLDHDRGVFVVGDAAAREADDRAPRIAAMVALPRVRACEQAGVGLPVRDALVRPRERFLRRGVVGKLRRARCRRARSPR